MVRGSDPVLKYGNMITFNVEDVAMPELEYGRVEDWIVRVAANHGYTCGRLTYLFCGDEYILRANREFINHDYYTDIITFDYTRHARIAGDIMISLDTVASNAEVIGVPYRRELLRVIIHGVLHLCGIDDKGPGERAIMEAHENEALALYDEMEK